MVEPVSRIREIPSDDEYKNIYEQAEAYYHGHGVEQNYSEASRLYYLLASKEDGYAEAQYKLGCMHRDGLGVQKSKISAKIWLSKARARGHLNAAIVLTNLDAYFKVNEKLPKKKSLLNRLFGK